MAGLIPQDFIDDLLGRADLGEVIGNRIQIKKAGREFKACCPFHNEKTPSFTISPDKGFYHCFGCSAHGTALTFLMDYDKLSFVDAVEELASMMGVDVPREGTDAPVQSNAPVFDILNDAAIWFQGKLKDAAPAVEYLKGRGLDGSTAQKFMIGFAPDGWDNLIKALANEPAQRENALTAGLVIRKEERVYDRFRNRIIFPIRDIRGRVIAFGGRTMDKNDGAKYLNSPETPVFHKGRELYGLYEARQVVRKFEQILVVEGYMDVVSLAQHGVPNVVATLGTATTPDHLKRLFRLTPDIAFCFDGDRAGRQAAWKALQVSLPEMRDGRQVHFLFLPDGEDPDSIAQAEGSDGFNKRLQQALPLSAYLLQELEEQTDMTTMDGRARLAELAKPLLQKIPAGVYRDLLQQKVAQQVGLNTERLGQHIDDGSDYEPYRPQQRQTQPNHPGKPQGNTPVRHAVRIILQYAERLDDFVIPEDLPAVQQAGIPLIVELLEIIKSQNTVNSGMLIERFRDRPEREHLEKLQGQALPDLSEPANELQDTLLKIINTGNHQRLEELTAKAAEGLSESEKEEFRALSRWKASQAITDN